MVFSWGAGGAVGRCQNQSESLHCIVSSDPLTWTWFNVLHCYPCVSADEDDGDPSDPKPLSVVVRWKRLRAAGR